MKKYAFTCEVITPLVMFGIDGTTPELRPPSIKGVLRFWWRAMNGHLTSRDEKDATGKKRLSLRSIESEIFGDTQKRSRVIIQVLESPTIEVRTSLLPHKGGSEARGFRPSETFIIQLSMADTIKFSDGSGSFSIEDLKKLFILVCTLGGFGKRSRRGFGSVRILKINGVTEKTPTTLPEIYKLLPPQYFTDLSAKNNCIVSNFGRNENYPFIKKIEIGRKQSNILRNIGDVTHKFHKIAFDNYGPSLGMARGGRFASPIYVSTLKDISNSDISIVTTLKTVPKHDFNKISVPLQEDFKNAIL